MIFARLFLISLTLPFISVFAKSSIFILYLDPLGDVDEAVFYFLMLTEILSVSTPSN